MMLVRYVGMLALSAFLSQSVAAKERVAAKKAAGVRYRLVGQPNVQCGRFHSISERGLILSHHTDAPLDTLPLSVLKAVEVERGRRTKVSSVVSLTFLGIIIGGVAGGEKAEAGYDVSTMGAIMGGVAGVVVGGIPVRRWELVHGWSVAARPIAPSSYAMVLKSQF